MVRANEIRWPSRFLALDEEIISSLSRWRVVQYCKDKKHSRGAKVFSLNGCNFLGTSTQELLDHGDERIHKGYYHYIDLYRGKSRDKPNPFSIFGKGFSVVCKAIISLGIRFKGYYVVCDS